MQYYQDCSLWKIGTDNEHLGLVVSGWNEEQKNVNKKISLWDAWTTTVLQVQTFTTCTAPSLDSLFPFTSQIKVICSPYKTSSDEINNIISQKDSQTFLET